MQELLWAANVTRMGGGVEGMHTELCLRNLLEIAPLKDREGDG
jgi:hypothetical protein